MSLSLSDVPWGIKALQKLTDRCCPRFHFNREICYRSSVVFLTYIAYMCYHLSRKPISVVKAVLHRNCSNLAPPETNDSRNWCDWAPFDGSDASASHMLGELDSSFLFCYAIAMFVSGFVAERVNLRYFLSLGMLMSGIFCYLFGLAKTYEIHNLWYYVVVQGLAGIFQTTGWPGVVTVMSNWFGKSKRGLVFGIWNSHTSIGNILGSLIAAEYVETDWALSFVMPGFYVGIVGFILFLFLVVNPADVGCTSSTELEDRMSWYSYCVHYCHRRKLHSTTSHGDNNEHNRSANSVITRYRPLESHTIDEHSSGISSDVDDTDIIIGEQAIISRSRYLAEENLDVQRRVTERTTLLSYSSSETPDEAIGFLKACCIPGVLEYSLALFFSKLVSYTFLYWLPMYVNASTTMGATLSADMSTLFDVGGIAGAIIAGVLTDKSEMPACTCAFMLILAAPMMVIYEKVSTVNLGLNMILLVVVGLLVNGPYALITTSVSAELGTHESLEGNSKALATVTAIIDGTGSIGAAVGPLLAGFVSSYGWQNVFLMLMISDILALFLLLRLVKQEIIRFRNGRRAGIRIE